MKKLLFLLLSIMLLTSCINQEEEITDSKQVKTEIKNKIYQSSDGWYITKNKEFYFLHSIKFKNIKKLDISYVVQHQENKLILWKYWELAVYGNCIELTIYEDDEISSCSYELCGGENSGWTIHCD